MKILKSVAAMRRYRNGLSKRFQLGFVPTMGALHAGHRALLERAAGENHRTVASIFVNPLQFGPKEDFRRYPRTWRRDRALLEACGVDAVFVPSAVEMYPAGYSTRIQVAELSNVLCGSASLRGPAHFAGVATVVAKLFNTVRPTRAYFGMKDFQQLRVLERMVRDLDFDLKIIRCETVREPDGLAMSSRNAYLSPEERAAATGIFAVLQAARGRRKTERGAAGRLKKWVAHRLRSLPHATLDYVEIVDPDSLQSVTSLARPAVLAVAVKFGSARLIDNILLR